MTAKTCDTTSESASKRRNGLGGVRGFRLAVTLPALLLLACNLSARGGGRDEAVPKCGSWDRVEFVYRQRLSKTLGLDRPDRDLYARMLVIPSFEGEKSVSLFGPGPEGALTVAVAESEGNLWTASFEELRRSNQTIDELIELPLGPGVESREAPLDEVTAMRVVAAFDAFLKQARFPDHSPILADPTVYEFTGLLVGFGEACARLKIPRGSLPDNELFRLASALERYANASEGERPAIVEDLRRLAAGIAKP